LATSATGLCSVSRTIFTFCSSLNRLFLMRSPDGPEEAVCHIFRGPNFRGQVSTGQVPGKEEFCLPTKLLAVVA
jgi:hypothetical protein